MTEGRIQWNLYGFEFEITELELAGSNCIAIYLILFTLDRALVINISMFVVLLLLRQSLVLIVCL